jgi:hypothetical protein
MKPGLIDNYECQSDISNIIFLVMDRYQMTAIAAHSQLFHFLFDGRPYIEGELGVSDQ